MKHYDRLGFVPKRELLNEDESHRTFYGKTFNNVDGTKSYRTQLGTPIHYKEETLNADAPFLDIDLAPQVFSDRWEVKKSLYQLTVGDNGEVQYTSRQFGDMVWRPLQIGDSTNFKFDKITHESVGLREYIVFEEIRPGVDLMILIGSGKMEPLYRVKGPQAPREFLWEIDSTDAPSFTIGPGGRGWEAPNGKRRPLDISKQDGAPIVGGGRHKIVSEEVWSGDVWERGPDRQKVRKSDPRYPVLVDPPDVSESVAFGIDDVRQSNGGGFITSAPAVDLTYNTDGGTRQLPGFRFRSLGIPNAQALSTANLVLSVTSVGDGTIPAVIYADDVDDAALWSSANGPFQIAKTTAKAALSVPSTGARSFPITPIISEIVARPGWASGNDMRFIATVTQSTSYFTRAFAAYENVSLNPARLDITFSGISNPTANGDLLTQSAAATGTAVRNSIASGDLEAGSASVVGDANIAAHFAEGVLSASAATVVGAAEARTAWFASGELSAGNAAVVGAADALNIWQASGALQAGSAAVVGVADVLDIWHANGALAAGEALVEGLAVRNSVASGALVTQSAVMAGAAVLEHVGSGDIVAQFATVDGSGRGGDGWDDVDSGGQETWTPTGTGDGNDWTDTDTGGGNTWL